jgi:hypothetical protein
MYKINESNQKQNIIGLQHMWMYSVRKVHRNQKSICLFERKITESASTGHDQSFMFIFPTILPNTERIRL